MHAQDLSMNEQTLCMSHGNLLYSFEAGTAVMGIEYMLTPHFAEGSCLALLHLFVPAIREKIMGLNACTVLQQPMSGWLALHVTSVLVWNKAPRYLRGHLIAYQ